MLPEIAELFRIHVDEDITIERLATAIGISRAALSRLFTGDRQPWQRTLGKIRRYLESRKPKPVAKKRKPRRTRVDEATV